MTPHFWVFWTLILQLYVKLYASHSKLAIFQNMQCSRKFAHDFLNIAVEVYSSVARLSGDEMNGTPKNSALISKAMFLCTACTGSDCRSWKYVMAAMRNFAFACASRWSVATFFIAWIKELQAQINNGTLASPLSATGRRRKTSDVVLSSFGEDNAVVAPAFHDITQ